MGSTSTKDVAQPTTNAKTINNDSGFHMVEVHGATMAIGISSTLVVVAIVLCCWRYHRMACKRLDHRATTTTATAPTAVVSGPGPVVTREIPGIPPIASLGQQYVPAPTLEQLSYGGMLPQHHWSTVQLAGVPYATLPRAPRQRPTSLADIEEIVLPDRTTQERTPTFTRSTLWGRPIQSSAAQNNSPSTQQAP